MKVIVRPEFLFFYYYHAANNASDEVLKHKLPHSLYHAITSLILWQCVFESYANYQIRLYKLEDYQVPRRNSDSVMLPKASIKEKWIHLPIARRKPQFTLNKEPFTHFARLIALRNDFIHFNEKALSFEKNAPSAVQTVGDIMNWTKTGEFLSGSIYGGALRYAIAGKVIVRDMFKEYSRLTKDPLPDFLGETEVVLKVKIKK